MSLPTEARVIALAATASELWRVLRSETGPAQLVLPNATFFPDTFEPSANSVQRLLRRMQSHASLLDVPVEVVIHDAETDHSQGACGSGACAPAVANSEQRGRLELEADLWRLNLSRAELGHPIGLTTLMARALGTILLEETRRDGSPSVAARPELAELSAVQLGFGSLLLEGAHVYSKSCGGPQVTRLTALDVSELAVVVALFASAHQLKLKTTYAWLSATQKSALSLASDLVRANPALSAWVKNGPPREPQLLKLRPAKPKLFAWLQPKPQRLEDELAEAFLDGTLLDSQTLTPNHGTRQLPIAARPKAPPDELSQLVEEALAEARS